MRNLKSCLKVALDFVSPETMPAALAMNDDIRELPAGHAGRSDNVHARVTLLHAAHVAVHELQALQGAGPDASL